MTSTDSMFSVEILRTSTPPLGAAPPANDSDPPATVGLRACKLALLEIGAPSFIIAVPKAFSELLSDVVFT